MKEISHKNLRIFCLEFRKGMINRMSADGKCAMISWALQGYLNYAHGLKTMVYENKYHVWLVMEDELVLDCTADQFNNKKTKYPKIYIGKPLKIHKNGNPFKSAETFFFAE